ncbi:hypothetical protein ACSBR1_024770 [Camellia fascicularis]
MVFFLVELWIHYLVQSWPEPNDKWSGCCILEGTSHSFVTVASNFRICHRSSSYLAMAAIFPSQSSSINKTNNEEDHKDKKIEKIERIYKSYKEVISTLSKEKGWISLQLCQYQGFWFAPMYNLAGLMFIQQHFKPRPTDVLLISSPKFGTTWLKAIAFPIMKRTSYNSMYVAHPLLTTNPHDCVPFLKILLRTPSIADAEDLPSPCLFSSHIPYTLLPNTVFGWEIWKGI